MNKYLFLSLLVITVFVLGFVIIKNNPPAQTNMSTPTNTTPPAVSSPAPATSSSSAVLKTTQGDITIALDATQTPKTVANFIQLSQKNFYNNTVFHRVIKGFMIQGGDPKGDGTGGPGYTFADEPFTGEYTRGTVAMANAGPNTNGSQFFIMHQDYALPHSYVIFGHVVSGIEVVDKIAESPTQTSPSGENSKPVNPTKILSVTIQ